MAIATIPRKEKSLTFTVNRARTSFAANEKADEINMRLQSVKAIADLVGTLTGHAVNGSESLVENLSGDTLRQAMHCIQQYAWEIEAINLAGVQS